MRLRPFMVGRILAVVVLALTAVRGAGVDVPAGTWPEFPVELVLRPEVVPYQLENAVWSLSQTNGPFLKEPQLNSQHVVRRVLRFGRDTNNAFGLIWDQPRNRLYLDLNRNLDLTDDPAGVFSSTNKGSIQVCGNVTFPLQTERGLLPATLNLRLSGDQAGSWVQVQLTSRTLWQTKVTLEGEAWQVAVVDKLLGPDGPAASKFLLLRPWEVRTNQVLLDAPTCGLVPFPDRLFWLGRPLHLERRLATGDQAPACKVELTPQQPPMTELKLSGESICYTLRQASNGYTAVLRGPAGTLRIPAGRYTVSSVWLKREAVEAHRLDGPPLVVNATSATSLVLGGPLTNSVTVDRYGRRLVLNYQLKGADGGRYRLTQEDRQNPPQFTVYHNSKKVLSGKFQYG